MKGIFSTICCALLSVFTTLAAEQEGNGNQSTNQEQRLGYICEGTIWESGRAILNPKPESVTNLFIIEMMRDWIEGTESINGVTYMKVFRASDKDNYQKTTVEYIRTEGEKVYMLLDKDSDAPYEVLLFDYSLLDGEVSELGPIVFGCIMPDTPASVNCVDSDEVIFDNKSFKTMTMDVLLNGQHSLICEYPIKWIRGIGSESGLLDNIYSPESGGSRLLNVYHNGELVYNYTAAPSGIEETPFEMYNTKENKKYHIDGTIFRDGDKGICIQNGRKTIVK